MNALQNKSTNLESNKSVALAGALAQLEKQFGKGSVLSLGGDTKLDVDVISTGSIKLDRALGVGGLPLSKIVEVFGPESSGKTTVTLELIAQAQKKGKTCAFIDAEHALDPTYASKLGVNINDLYVSQPDTGEQALEIAECLVSSGAIDIVVVDSVAALVPKAELEGEMGQNFVGLHSRLMSQACRKLTGVIKKSNSMLVFVNQIRHKIGGIGNPEVTTGGNALKFYASVRLDIRRTGQVKEKDLVVGNQTRIKVVKNKVAAPFKHAETSIIFNKGYDYGKELLDLAVESKIIDKRGTWYVYKEMKLGQGMAASVQYIENNEELRDELLNRIKK
ncbi:recombinase RecA [Vibrio chagasii]|uniref:Protein RecA n=1 Tax=Vibrio chagasii TaxID=170679 RepID=A0A7V7NX15_9VIBR|nr:recombinase RecA [Vibrio chagasii]KAB0482389.1 recombinase RecA [Vibrio chagasii]